MEIILSPYCQVGGFDYEDYGYLDTIIEFNGEREVWMERKEKLSFPRSEATAVLVDEAVVSCG